MNKKKLQTLKEMIQVTKDLAMELELNSTITYLKLAEQALSENYPQWIDYNEIESGGYVPPHSHLQMILESRGWMTHINSDDSPYFTRHMHKISREQFLSIDESIIRRGPEQAAVKLEANATVFTYLDDLTSSYRTIIYTW